MTTRWLLDTSALLALRDDEDGAERVENACHLIDGFVLKPPIHHKPG